MKRGGRVREGEREMDEFRRRRERKLNGGGRKGCNRQGRKDEEL